MFYIPLYKLFVGTAVQYVDASALEQKSTLQGCCLLRSG